MTFSTAQWDFAFQMLREYERATGRAADFEPEAKTGYVPFLRAVFRGAESGLPDPTSDADVIELARQILERYR